MASYNITAVSPLCHIWKACICLGVCIWILVPFSCSANYFLGRQRFPIFHSNISIIPSSYGCQENTFVLFPT